MNTKSILLLTKLNEQLNFTDIEIDDPIQRSENAVNIIINAVEKFVLGHPQVAQVAIQQGKNLAYNFVALNTNKSQKSFTYNDKGSMAIIGRAKAVADIPNSKMHFNGFFAWIMWLFIHLISLINYRNRLKTLYNWSVAYFTKDQSLRMIVRPK